MCLMKLAIYEDKNHENSIKDCCESNNAYFIPLFENRFAILTTEREVSYGAEDGTHSNDYNVKTFVNVYQCVRNTLNKKKKLFGNKKSIYYSGELLDNSFFKNVISLCEENGIDIVSLKYTSNLSPDNEINDLDFIKNKIVCNPKKYKVIKLIIDIDGYDIIFNKIGYVDIGADYDFFKDHEKLILTIIIAGLKD